MRFRSATVILPVLTVLALWAGLPASLTATTLTVDARPGYTDGVEAVGLTPIRCTGRLDCDEIEAQVAEALRQRTGWTVIEPAEVEEEMDFWRDRRALPGNMAALAQDVGADALLIVDLRPRRSKESVELQVEAFRPPALRPRCAAAARRAFAGGSRMGGNEMLQVHFLSAKTGEALMQGVAVGRGVAGKSTRRTVRTLIALLEKALGE